MEGRPSEKKEAGEDIDQLAFPVFWEVLLAGCELVRVLEWQLSLSFTPENAACSVGT